MHPILIIPLKLLKFSDTFIFYVLVNMHRNKNRKQYKVVDTVHSRFRNLVLPYFNKLTLIQHSISYVGLIDKRII